jgi:hypothetical protein
MPQTLNREQCPVGGALARAASPTLIVCGDSPELAQSGRSWSGTNSCRNACGRPTHAARPLDQAAPFAPSFISEKHGFGVSNPSLDGVFGTFRGPAAIEKAPRHAISSEAATVNAIVLRLPGL